MCRHQVSPGKFTGSLIIHNTLSVNLAQIRCSFLHPPCPLNDLVLGTPLCHYRTHSGHQSHPQDCRRRVLLMVDLDQTRELVTELESDAMDITTRAFEPNIRPSEELALFTYARLMTLPQIRQTTVETILYSIVDYIFSTWGVILSPDSIDLRWQDDTGDVFVLRNHQTIGSLLAEYRPHWLNAQESGILRTINPFARANSPYIMRVSCHKALTNPTHLP